MESRRADQRFERQMAMEFQHGGHSYSARMRNLSLGGTFIETDVSMAFGDKVRLRFRLPSEPQSIEVEGQVRWSESGDGSNGGGVGVRFVGLRARDVWALNKYLTQPQR